MVWVISENVIGGSVRFLSDFGKVDLSTKMFIDFIKIVICSLSSFKASVILNYKCLVYINAFEL